ncbi:MAG: flagellin, partial [Selenomonadaceae bacterium]|nr:flagellin [Selenomonadaceae bacterium]
MSLQINRSFAAISDGALQSYHSNQTTMGKSITRVSTGKRVNTAADDVGAYASSHRLKADSAAYNALYRGVQSGATYLNAADKAMTSIVDMLTAMREKALEYQTTDNDDQKTVLENEFNALYDAAKSAVYTKVGTNDSMLTDGGEFSFVTGLQSSSSAEEVDLSNAPSDVKTFTVSSSYTLDGLDKSSISYYKASTENSDGTLVIADKTYTLTIQSNTNKLLDLAGQSVGDVWAIKDSGGNIVGAYKVDSANVAIDWDIESYKPSDTNTI